MTKKQFDAIADSICEKERLPLPWRFASRNVPLADTGDYDGVIEIRAANNNVVAEAWNPSDDQEAAFRQIVEEMNRPPVEPTVTQERTERILQAAVAFVDAVGTEMKAGIVSRQAPDEWLELSDAVICLRHAVPEDSTAREPSGQAADAQRYRLTEDGMEQNEDGEWIRFDGR